MTPAFAYRFDCPDRSIVFRATPGLRGTSSSWRKAPTCRCTKCGHLLASHSTTEQVGRIATEAGVKTLELSHFVPGGYPFLKDEVWFDAVRPYFNGNLVVGRDLLDS